MFSRLWLPRPRITLSDLPSKASDSVFSAFGWTVATFFLFVLAFAVYIGFYVLFVPAPLHVKQVHFQFKTHGFSERSKEKVGYHSSDEFPTATVNLRNGDFDQTSDGEMILARGQRYRVSLILHVPYSEDNKKVGMFMTSILFLSKNNHEVGSATRSALIPFSSPVVSTLSSLVDFFYLHWRWKQESEKLNIRLFENFVDDSYHPSESVVITLYCKSLQIYAAELRIEAVFSGIRYYMFYWPLTAATLGISSNIIIGFLLAVWLYFKYCREPPEDEESEESFVIDDIMGNGFNTETDSTAVTVATNRRESHGNERQDRYIDEHGNQTLGGTEGGPPFAARRIVPARRTARERMSTLAERQRREPPVSLTRRPRSVREKKDGSCQTEPNLDGRSEQAFNGSKDLKAE